MSLTKKRCCHCRHLLLLLLLLAGRTRQQDPPVVQFIVDDTTNDDPARILEVELRAQTDPTFQAEEFCAIADVEDGHCADAVAEMRRQHRVTFPEMYLPVADLDGGRNDTSAVACEIAGEHQMLQQQQQQQQQQMSNRADAAPIVRAWMAAAERWSTTGGTSSSGGMFSPESPYDGRMAWAASPGHPVFRFPSAVDSHDEENEEAAYGDEGDESHWTPSDVARRLADLALSPWVARGGITSDDVAASLQADHGDSCVVIRVGGTSPTVESSGDDGDGADSVEVSLTVSRACAAPLSRDETGAAPQRPGDSRFFVRPTVPHDEPWWRVRRRNAALQLMREAIDSPAFMTPRERRAIASSGAEFVLCVSDCVVSASQSERLPWRYPNVAEGRGGGGKGDGNVEAGAGGLPVALSLVACAGSEAIAFPVFMNRSTEDDSLAGWEAFARRLGETRASRPFDGRRRKAVWRGGTRGKSCWDGTTNGTVGRVSGLQELQCGRRALRRAASDNGGRGASLFDVAYDFLDGQAQIGYQATIYAEGHCGWADRGRYLMLFGSVLLWQETMCREWYTLLLEPWRHYVPVDYHFRNLKAAAAWALCPANAAAVRTMLRRLGAFCNAVLTRTTATAYAAALLKKYAALWNKAARDEEGQQSGRPLPLPASFAGCPSEPVESYLERTKPFESYFDET